MVKMIGYWITSFDDRDFIAPTLTAGEKSSVAVVPIQNLQAWEDYQLGRQRMAKRTNAGRKLR